MNKEHITKIEVQARYDGLKVFKDDPTLEDMVFYNGNSVFSIQKGTERDIKNYHYHYYTDKETESTFTVKHPPTAEVIKHKSLMMRAAFKARKEVSHD